MTATLENDPEIASIGDNFRRVRERIAQAASRSGRSAETVTLVAVTKRVAPHRIRAALAAGATDLGENYVQEAATKIEGRDRVEVPSAARWHFIGHLQTNKAQDAVRLFDLIQGVDSPRAARAIGRQAITMGKTQPILIEVNLAAEVAGRAGVLPEQVADVAAEVASLAAQGVALRGLMAVAPPPDEGRGDLRDSFRLLRRLWEALPPENRQVLSMGMSNDFETAIEEGATMIRVGSALFGARKVS